MRVEDIKIGMSVAFWMTDEYDLREEPLVGIVTKVHLDQTAGWIVEINHGSYKRKLSEVYVSNQDAKIARGQSLIPFANKVIETSRKLLTSGIPANVTAEGIQKAA